MKTIDERATEWSENNKNLYGIDVPTLMEASYHQGATDQRAIDIEKAYQWLKRNTPIALMAEEKYEFLEDFKIAMNE